MWPVRTETYYKYKMHTRFWQLSMKHIKYVINNFFIDYMLKWYFGYTGFNKRWLKLVSSISFLFQYSHEKIFNDIHGLPSISIGQHLSTLLYYIILSLHPVAKPFLANGCILHRTISNMNGLSAWMVWWRMWKGTKEEKQRCHLKLSAAKSWSSEKG